MPTAWFLVPYRVDHRMNSPARTLAFNNDELHHEITSVGGEWSEAEINGNQAIVRVRASSSMLATIGLVHRTLSET